jgi:purine-cytosine permease-like protein
MADSSFHDTDAFRVEQRGIDFVGHHERWASPRDIASLWAGVSTNIQYFVYGAILPVFGLPVWTAVAVVLLGNLSYLLLAVASLQGPTAGTTTFTISRASFGVRGSRVMSFSNWITQLGFETEGLLLIVGATVTMFSMANVTVSTTGTVAIIVVATACMVVLPYFGHATMVKVLRYLIAPFIVAYLGLVIFISGDINVSVVDGAASDWKTLSLALAFSFTLAGLSWTENGNDYTRYLPRTASRPAIVGWLFGATAVPQVLTMLVGFFTVAAFPVSPDWLSANPFGAFVTSHHGAATQHVVPSWFVVIFLVLAITQLFAINSLDLYSSGVSLQAMGLRVKRYQAVLLDGVIAGSLTTWVTFASTFADYMRTFVGVVIIWITPWLAIYLTDWLVRRRHYDERDLQDTSPTGRYYGYRGVNWNAMSALLVGMSLALSAYAKPFGAVGFPPKWMSPITGAFGWYDEGSLFGGLADLSIPLGFVAAALTYYVLDRDAGVIAHQESRQPLHLVATRTPLFATGLAALWSFATVLTSPTLTSSLVALGVGVVTTGTLWFIGRGTNAGRDVISTAGVLSLIVTAGMVSYHRSGSWWIAPVILAVLLFFSRWCVPSTKSRVTAPRATD